MEAALKYWNRIGKPRIEEVKIEPRLKLNPVLLDRAFAFSPASVLELDDFLASTERLKFLEVFPRYRLELLAKPGGDFDVSFHGSERNGWGDSRIQGLLALVSGVPYQTIYPEFFNLRRSAVNLVSLLRWDAQKRRAFASMRWSSKRCRKGWPASPRVNDRLMEVA